ncbi:MAG: GPI mannosyltransferase 1 [Bathelium mastoideum]|nr:MAG: GPI mannosyltransferase 1 [Bathelium mastoideum]
MDRFWSSPRLVFGSAAVLRVLLLAFGQFQDAFSSVKYTDIDYYVFTDAARYVAAGRSPYLRDTYRYTPLLAWMLVPTTWGGTWFLFGKLLFALGDIIAGWFIYRVLRGSAGMPPARALKFTSIWILNPMVAQISTRGSSEGLLGMIIMALLWSVMQKKIILAGCLLGFAVHFKIYPFIYAASIVLWLDENTATRDQKKELGPDNHGLLVSLARFCNKSRVLLALSSAVTFFLLNAIMFAQYGWPFLEHTYFYHLVRTDHRHNFSPYNILLYLKASPQGQSKINLEKLAFIPQLSLSLIAIPLALAKKDMASSMLAQTFAFVTFNKVCTSQYFLWYMVFLPFYMPSSSLLERPMLGGTALVLWVFGQVLWIQQAYQLEFLGQSTFMPGLWASSIAFFFVNVWILSIVITDVGQKFSLRTPERAGGKKSS